MRRKVSAREAGGITGVVTGFVTWLLVTYVFKGHIPVTLATAIPYVIGVGLAWIASIIKRDVPIGIQDDFVRIEEWLQANGYITESDAKLIASNAVSTNELSKAAERVAAKPATVSGSGYTSGGQSLGRPVPDNPQA